MLFRKIWCSAQNLHWGKRGKMGLSSSRVIHKCLPEERGEQREKKDDGGNEKW